MYHSGYDHFCPDPGAWESKKCLVCDTDMDVKRDCEGPTSSIMAMAKSKRKYDSFTCPHAGKDWHTQALRLQKEINNTPSFKLALIMSGELEDLLAERVATK